MTLRGLCLLAGVALGAGGAAAQTVSPRQAAPARYGIGRPATPSEIAAIDIDVRPDGRSVR